MTDICPPKTKEGAESTSSSPVLPKKCCCESKLSLTVDSPEQFKGDSLDMAAMERGDWLTDTHTSLVNDILRHQFPSVSGLQNTLLGQNPTFERMSKPYVQIIHTDGDHWLAVQGIHESFVKAYDSRKKSMSRETQLQIANLTLSSEKAIIVHIQHTQYQIGTSDCGLYAIVFVTAMCHGNNPSCYR